MPSSLAKEQISRSLSHRSNATERPRVWTFADVWTATALEQSDPPIRLSPASILTVFDEAIDRARRAGDLDQLQLAIRLPGYRRQLLDRFQTWTRGEWSLDGPKPDGSSVGVEEFALFGHYRAILFDLKAEDPEGWAVWMSKALLRKPPLELRKPDQVVVIDPTSPSQAQWRLIEHCAKKARSMVVTLPHDPDPSLADLYAAIDPIRQRFLDAGFIEEAEPTLSFSSRPPGLQAVERELFRANLPSGTTLKASPENGLKILGGPKGMGVALLVAREVQRALHRGIEPEEILILAPRVDADAERIRETLQAWNLPVDLGKAQRLATVPAVSALRLALRISVDGWQTSSLVQLLRNGQIGWNKRASPGRFSRYEAASAILKTRVFRDRETLKTALEQALSDPDLRNPHAGVALRMVESLGKLLDPVARRGDFSEHLRRVERLADLLELDRVSLAPLRDALEDQAEVLETLGPKIWEWADFVKNLDATVSAIELPRALPMPGSIRIESVAGVEGARARVVILTGLVERSFPTADAIDLDSATDRLSLAYAREMFRFASVSGLAEEGLILAFPTSDGSGEKLLPAAFLEELIRRLDSDSQAACVEQHSRLEPLLLGHEDLARSPGDARVLAVAMACRNRDFSALQSLSRRPDHASSFRGISDAFAVASRRRQEPSFGRYDGWLEDPKAIERIRERFGPEQTFSPSQLESFALCPFQFYQRYVLGLKLVDERQELDEDYAGRGDDVHRVLDQIHSQMVAEEATNVIERLGILIETQMRVKLEQYDGKPGDVAAILDEIGLLRTRKALGRYVSQFASYARNAGEGATPRQFEVVFGAKNEDSSIPRLTLGKGSERLQLQGKIDRIDLVAVNGKIRFRVIDYKTGANPSVADVRDGLASQLPLYTMAVESLVFSEGRHELADFGYWSLRGDGYRQIKLKGDWDVYREKLMKFVLELVASLRHGVFPVESLKHDCSKRCDYQAACRIGEVRMVGKSWNNRPKLEAKR